MYILAKYLGVLLSVLLPVFIIVFMVGTLVVIRGIAPLSFLGPLSLAFLTIAVPSHAFVVAFSLACPLVMPLRVYQVLFTGYWFWGNLLSPQAFPTISDTVLNAVGQYQLQGFFGMYFDASNMETHFTAPEAVINLIVLSACIASALFVLDRYLRWQARRA
jgi:ABC-2 type transport system permease protein